MFWLVLFSSFSRRARSAGVTFPSDFANLSFTRISRFLFFQADRFATCELSTLDALPYPFLLVMLAFVDSGSLRPGRIFAAAKPLMGKNTCAISPLHIKDSE